MKTFNREQLIKAQQKWNKDFVNNPEDFPTEIDGTKKYATEQIDHLSSLV